MDARFYHSLTEGDFSDGLLLCQGLTEGDFWTRLDGCSLVHRGAGHLDAIDYTQVVAVGPVVGEVVLGEPVSHAVQTDYFYAVRWVSPTGKAEQGMMAVVRLSLDAAGERHSARPNPVSHLTAKMINQGRVQLNWWYWPLGEETAADHFIVYGDGGTGQMDWGQALGDVPYTGPHCYGFDTEPGKDGQTYRFAVRSVAADGTDDGHVKSVAVTINLSAPEGVEGVQGWVGF